MNILSAGQFEYSATYMMSVNSCVTLSLHQMTPLHVVAERGRSLIVKPLVSQGADVDITDDKGVINCICAAD